MVIIITGSSHVGKTLLAQQMLEKFKYPYLSIDHLKMGLIRSGNTDLTPEDDDELTSYLLEGCYIPSDWRKDFDDNYLSSIKFICLAMTEEYIETHFDEIIGHESEIESRLIQEDCTIGDLKECNRWFIEAFGNAGERVTLIEDDFGEAIAQLMDQTGSIIQVCGGNQSE